MSNSDREDEDDRGRYDYEQQPSSSPTNVEIATTIYSSTGGDGGGGGGGGSDPDDKRRKKKKKSDKKSSSSSSTNNNNGRYKIPASTSSSSPTRASPIHGPTLRERLAPIGNKLADVRRWCLVKTMVMCGSGRTDPRTMMKRIVVLAILCVAMMIFLNETELVHVFPEDAQPAQAPTERPTEEIIVQKLSKTRSHRVNLALERGFGCRELDCIAACNGKAKPKCLKSRSCVAQRNTICEKRCRKARCEERCKDEPHLGYVEREQGLEKCKDECTGPTATHNKCVVKCHVKFKPCKSRCFETANKYKCDKPTTTMSQSVITGKKGSSSSSSSSDDDDGGGGGGGGGDDEESEDAPPPPPPSQRGSSKSKPAIAGLDDDDLL